MKGVSSNLRRSQRLFLQIPVVLEGPIAGKPDFAEKTRTVVVSAHGALVELSVAAEKDQIVTLQNGQTNERQESKVVLVSDGEKGKFNVAVEFTSPNPGFWGVNFPPADWTIRHEDAKRNH